MNLQDYLAASSLRHGDRIAVEEADSERNISYTELDALSDRLRDRLVALGVERSDRVGFWLHKSIDAVASIFGILKAGAAYVPVDPGAPASRNAYIFGNCRVRVVIVAREFLPALEEASATIGYMPPVVVVDSTLRAALDEADTAAPAAATASVAAGLDELAYILYTSGSTGHPKGVMISHGNALSFVDWCIETLQPRCEDRFSSHAPLHFDLSILDIFTPIATGATVILIPADMGKEPLGLVDVLVDRRISIWYSTPTVLSLMLQRGRLDTRTCPHLRIVLFAGEVFPVTHLNALRRALPGPRYLNLYGPTETNVCTWYELPPEIEEDRTEPYPIGQVCSNSSARVVDADGNIVSDYQEGELCVAGGTVMLGYWDLPDRSESAFLGNTGAERWYRTGDLVQMQPDGNYRYVGRRDRMIKKRGYRVELGEIEVCLYSHPEVKEVAVTAASGAQSEVTVCAHVVSRSGERISVIALKRHCAERIPLYMVPDTFRFYDVLPKTSTDKTDYQVLARLAQG